MARTTKKPTSRKGRSVQKKAPPRAKGGEAKGVPIGRTLSTYDHYLGHSMTGSQKRRPVVVIEKNRHGDLAVVPLSSREGKNRTHLKKYGDGKSYFKHFVEIEDDEGKPIRVNKKFDANHPSLDVSRNDVVRIRETVFRHSKPKDENLRKIEKFRK